MFHGLLSLFHFIFSRRRRNVNYLVHLVLELVKSKRSIVKCGGQAETMLNQHFLTGTVTCIHRPNLRQGNVRFVNNEKKIFREVVNQSEGSFPCFTTCQMAGIVFDAGAVTHFVHHFQIVIGTLLQTLRFQKFATLVQKFQAFFQFNLNVFHGTL